MNLPRLVVFGEALTDFIREDAGHWRSVAGGSCWNVARVAARLGVPTGFAGTVSRDMLGDELMALSAEAGLDMRFMCQVDRAPLLAMVVSKQPPQYFLLARTAPISHSIRPTCQAAGLMPWRLSMLVRSGWCANRWLRA